MNILCMAFLAVLVGTNVRAESTTAPALSFGTGSDEINIYYKDFRSHNYSLAANELERAIKSGNLKNPRIKAFFQWKAAQAFEKARNLSASEEMYTQLCDGDGPTEIKIRANYELGKRWFIQKKYEASISQLKAAQDLIAHNDANQVRMGKLNQNIELYLAKAYEDSGHYTEATLHLMNYKNAYPTSGIKKSRSKNFNNSPE